MIESVSQTIVIFFGLLVSLLSLYGLILPRQLVTLVANFWQQSGAMATAVLIRVLLGLNLILAATASSSPTAFAWLGGLVLLSAIILLLVGKESVDKVFDVVKQLSDGLVRGWLLLGLGFGGFIIYALL